jgi:hypothetical protein
LKLAVFGRCLETVGNGVLEETLRTIHRTKRRQSNNITRKTKTLTNTEPMKTEGEPTCSLSTIFQLNFATIPTVWYDVWYDCVVRRVVRRVVRLCGTTCGTTVWYDVWYDCVLRLCFSLYYL